MNIELIIRDLLLHNSHLVIPGFGTFRVVHKPAQISKTTQLLMPPTRDVLFDSHHTKGDNQLLLSIRKKMGLSEAGSGEELEKFLHRLEEEIRSSGTAVLEGLGKLTRDKTGNLKFEAREDILNLTGEFSLPQIEIKVPGPVEKMRQPPPPEPAPAAAVETRKATRWWIPAAIVLFLAVVAVAAYYAGFFGSRGKQKPAMENSMAEAEEHEKLVFGSREPSAADSLAEDSVTSVIRRQLEEKIARENALRPDKPAQKTEPEIEPKGEKPAPVPLSPVQTGYHIISGSFTVAENAEKQASHLRDQGLNPVLLPKKGRYIMVSLGTYATRTEAAASLNRFRQQLDQDLWIMKISD